MKTLKQPEEVIYPSEQEVFDQVVEYLKKTKRQYPILYEKMILFGAKPNDIIKFITNRSATVEWNFDYKMTVDFALNRIYDEIIDVIPYPALEPQSQEDIIVAKILSKIEPLLPSIFKIGNFCVSFPHIIAFLNRDAVITDWNPDFVIDVMRETQRLKDELIGQTA